MGFHPDWNTISGLISASERIFIKKLSRNDCSWADSSANGHQNGFFIPREIAESGFFPELRNTNPEKPHIFDCTYPTFWPASGEVKDSTIKYFSLRNPGKPNERPRYEWQHTGVPKEQFQSLSPASLLVCGALAKPISGASYWFVVIDSTSGEAEITEAAFSLDADFHFGLFSPDVIASAVDDEDQLIFELNEALRNGSLDQYIAKQRLPESSALAREAQDFWLQVSGATSLNPFELEAPGDVVMRISRDLEFKLYKKAELHQRAAQVAGLLLRNEDVVSSLVRGFTELDQIFLSASQTRKSRAGLSFEHHVKRLLVDGSIRHEEQVMLGGRRPDFVLPSVAEFNDSQKTESLILSLKTTLRERWKQLGMERKLGHVFLATVDDRISVAAVEEMAANRIILVVPESLKKSEEAVYKKQAEVITFSDFFHEQIRERRPTLLL
ncbi:MAG TPA: type II restriction endonuclease [Steroidobacteraceae bacterium]|nr:type II restriction endonuclease [Steroidobacteraceae bacterium]